MAQQKNPQTSVRLTEENDEWIRNYLYYKQINTENPKLSMADVINEAIEVLRQQRGDLPIFPRPDFIRVTERRMRRPYNVREK